MPVSRSVSGLNIRLSRRVVLAGRDSDRPQVAIRSRRGEASTRRRSHRKLSLESLSARRVLAAITGSVFEDADASLHANDAESGLVGRLVYIDENINGVFDFGEPNATTGTDGTFNFADLPDGDYRLALFNGSTSQTQTTPIAATRGDDVTGLSDVLGFVDDLGQFAFTDDSVLVVDADAGSAESIEVASNVTSARLLSGGLILVTTGQIDPDSGEFAFVVSPTDQSVTPVDATSRNTIGGLASAAVGDGDVGPAIPTAASGSVFVHHVDAADASDVQISATTVSVPAGTRAFGSADAVRSILATPQTGGTAVSLWSNRTASLITPTPVQLPDTTGVAAFDESAGLLAMRTTDGGVTVFDVDANFAPLQSFADVDGPFVLDADRDRILTFSPATSSLRMADLGGRQTFAEVALDSSGVGAIRELSIGAADRAVLALGAGGLVENRLDQPLAVDVTIASDENVDGVLFGMSVDGSNTPPTYSEVPSFETEEDTPLIEAAPAVLQISSDAEGDDYIVLLRSGTENGSLQLTPAGGLTYVPDANFFGTDDFVVALFDGRDASPDVTISIEVTPVPDAPIGIDPEVLPIPENHPLLDPLGDVEVIDADGPGHVIEINDPRFDVDNNGQIILVAGPLNFETEPFIPITITATDQETGDTVTAGAVVTVTDANDPITGITPTSATVRENQAGALVAELEVVDEDAEQFHLLTVDDDRFIVDNFDLRLRSGEALDFEATPVIVVNVTATEFGGDNTFTQEITIRVEDVPEQPQGMALTSNTVRELVMADVVGQVLIDNQTPDDRFQFTTNDGRFVVDGDTLRLADGETVERGFDPTIDLTITAVDSQGEFASFAEDFVIEILPNDYPGHNLETPFDVDHNGQLQPLDALLIINFLNENGPSPVGPTTLDFCYDVNGDGFIDVVDALLVINEINRRRIAGGGGEAEGEGDGGNPKGGEGEAIPAPPSPALQLAFQEDLHLSEPAPDEVDDVSGEAIPRGSAAGTVGERFNSRSRAPRASVVGILASDLMKIRLASGSDGAEVDAALETFDDDAFLR